MGTEWEDFSIILVSSWGTLTFWGGIDPACSAAPGSDLGAGDNISELRLLLLRREGGRDPSHFITGSSAKWPQVSRRCLLPALCHECVRGEGEPSVEGPDERHRPLRRCPPTTADHVPGGLFVGENEYGRGCRKAARWWHVWSKLLIRRCSL